MIQLQLDHSGVDPTAQLRLLDDYTAHLQQVRDSGYEQPESSINLPTDQGLLEKVHKLAAQKVTPTLKYSVVVGIGGSNLGTKAVYDALLGARDLLEPDRFPKMLFAETTDPELLKATAKLLTGLSSPEEVLITVISKSGGTTETIANFEILMHALQDKFGPGITDRVVAITDEGSKLQEAARAQSFAVLHLPKLVGGRYSVLSAVGLFPLLSVGIDVAQLRLGAAEILSSCLSGDNLAAQSATVLAAQPGQGRNINDNFFFHPELESVGKWYRQLMGESVGKEKSLDERTVHAGITPTFSLGSTDLHSVGQLYLGGPKDKFTTFVATAKSAPVTIPTERTFPGLVPMIAGKSASEIMTAILEGTKVAYAKAELPFMEVTLDAVDARSIGAFLQFKMLEMMYLGHLMNVDPFDQPNVESYKIETKRLLENADA